MTEEEIKVFLFLDCKVLFGNSPPQGLQKRVVKEYGLFKEEEEKITCPICLEVVAPGQEVNIHTKKNPLRISEGHQL